MVAPQNRVFAHFADLDDLDDKMAEQKASRSERPKKTAAARNLARNLHWELRRPGAKFKTTAALAAAVSAEFGEDAKASPTTLANWLRGDTGQPTDIALQEVAAVLEFGASIPFDSLKEPNHIHLREMQLKLGQFAVAPEESSPPLPAVKTTAETQESIIFASSYDTLLADEQTTRAVIDQVLSHPRAGEHLRLFAFMLRNITRTT